MFQLGEIRRSIANFIDDNDAWNAERGQLANENEIAECDLRYDRKAIDFAILVSVHTRNLFDLLGRFDKRVIPIIDYDGSQDGEVTLRELFNVLVHHRYYRFDGTLIRDLFPDDFKKKQSALSGRFMGYGFDLLDFINGITSVIEDVRVKDLTQLLRRKFKGFTAKSEPQDVVSLIQNVRAFSDLLLEKIPSAGYQFMASLMFDRLANARAASMAPPSAGSPTTVTQYVSFRSPSIEIDGNLMKKAFKIRVQCAMAEPSQSPDNENLQEHTVSVGYEEFLKKVNDAFGDDRILTDGSLQFVAANCQ